MPYAPCSLRAYHVYVVRLDPKFDRSAVFQKLRASGIGVNVHYIPAQLHPFYRNQFGTETGLCPVAEKAYERILSLPLFPKMIESDVDGVILAIKNILNY